MNDTVFSNKVVLPKYIYLVQKVYVLIIMSDNDFCYSTVKLFWLY